MEDVPRTTNPRMSQSHPAIATTATTSKVKTHTVAWAIFEQLVNLAAEANIPLGGGAFSVARELINIYNVRPFA